MPSSMSQDSTARRQMVIENKTKTPSKHMIKTSTVFVIPDTIIPKHLNCIVFIQIDIRFHYRKKALAEMAVGKHWQR